MFPRQKILIAFMTLLVLLSNSVSAKSPAITIGSSCVGIKDEKNPNKTNVYSIKNIDDSDFSMSRIIRYGYHVNSRQKYVENFKEKYAGDFLFTLENLKYYTEDMLKIDDQCQKDENCRKKCFDEKRFNCYSSCKKLVGNKGVKARVINKATLEYDVQKTYNAAEFKINIHKADVDEVFCVSENDKRTKVVVEKTCEQMENEFKLTQGSSKESQKSNLKSNSGKATSN